MKTFLVAVIFLLMVLSISTSATAAEASSPYAVNRVNNEVKDNPFNLTLENDAVLGVVARINSFTCLKISSFPLVLEQRDIRTQEWRWVSTKELPGITMEFEQSSRVPLGLKNLNIGLYRASFQNVLVQWERGACGTRQARWGGSLQTETIIFEVDANGAVMAPKARDVHRILAFDGIAYLDKVARFAVVAPEPFVLTLYQEFGSQRFVFRQTVVDDTLSEGKWSQLTIDRFFPDTFRDNLPVRYTMTGTRSGVTVFGIFAPPI